MKEKTKISLGYASEETGLAQLLQFTDDFNKKQGKLEVIPQLLCDSEDEMADKLFLSRKDATLPDIVVIHSEKIPHLCKKDLILPLDELIKSFLISFWDFHEAVQPAVTYKNQIWALPLLHANPRALFYNRSLFSQRKISSSPKNRDEFKDACRVLTCDLNNDGLIDAWGFLPESFHFIIFLLQNGGRLLDDSGKSVMFHEQEGIEALRFLHHLTTNYSPPHQDFAKGDVGMCIASPEKFHEIRDIKVHVTPLPAGRFRQNTFGDFRGALCFAVARKKRKKPSHALEFLKWWDELENYVRWCMFTHHVPLKKSALTHEAYDEYLKNYPVMKIFVEEMSFVSPLPMNDASLFMRQSIERMIQLLPSKEEKDELFLQSELDRAASAVQNILDGTEKV